MRTKGKGGGGGESVLLYVPYGIWVLIMFIAIKQLSRNIIHISKTIHYFPLYTSNPC